MHASVAWPSSLYPSFLTRLGVLCSWDKTSVTHFSDELKTNASVATAMAVGMLPEFGINATTIRSVGDGLSGWC